MRIAFDLDETLGTPMIKGEEIIGFVVRTGAHELLQELVKRNKLMVWTVSNRSYLDKILNSGIKQYFDETYSWDEINDKWKDIRKIKADYLIDDSEHHIQEARKYGMEERYILIPAYGSKEDNEDPLLWAKIISGKLGLD